MLTTTPEAAEQATDNRLIAVDVIRRHDPAKPKLKFRLVHGGHVGWSPDGTNPRHFYGPGDVIETPNDLAARDPLKYTRLGIGAGDAVVYRDRPSKMDPQPGETNAQYAARLYAAAEAAARAAEVGEGKSTAPDKVPVQPVTPPPPTAGTPQLDEEDLAKLDKMSATQLKSFAADQEIDLAGARTPAEMLKVIKAALTAG